MPRMRANAVWLGMDQASLDAAYDQAKYAPNLPQILKRYASNSADFRSRHGDPRREAYGPGVVEALDIYSPRSSVTSSGRGQPVTVFVHGGAWRSGLARDYGFLAEMFVHAGAHFVVPDFAWVQDVGGSLEPMADQLRRALAWVHANAQNFGGDPDRIYVCGHSSGAHLAGVLLTTDWRGFDLPADCIKGGLCCSGIYDLEPVALSARSSYLKLTLNIQQGLSPQRHIEHLQAPLVLAYGDLETPEFQRQAVDFAAAVKATGQPVKLLVGEGYNHFEILETLANPYGLLGRAALEQMQLTQPK